MNRILILVAAGVIFTSNVYSQTYKTQQNQIFAYNILSNGLICGLGGAINKPKEEKFFKAFIRNFSKGCLGGLVKYSAKRQTYYLRDPDYTFLAPINRLYFFLGYSIATNASLNKKMFDTYYCNFYGIDLRVNMTNKAENRVSARLSLGTLFSVLYFSSINYKLDFSKSLKYGQFYFDFNSSEWFDGIAYYNAFAIKKSPSGEPYNTSIPHEIVHTYQTYDFFTLANLYRPRTEHIYKDKRFYKVFSKYLYLDYEIVFQSIIYYACSLNQPNHYKDYNDFYSNYYRNFLEYEAEHFGSRMFVPR